MSSFWRNFNHWLHRKLSKWQLWVQSVIKISSKWQHFRFSGSGKFLMSETGVTVLSVTISEKSCFPQHISVCCKKTARQLNALVRISKYLNINLHRAVYNNFIMSNFNYFPLVWQFCGQVNYQTFEKIQEKALEYFSPGWVSRSSLEKASASTSPVTIGAVAQMTFLSLCNYSFGLYIFAYP